MIIRHILSTLLPLSAAFLFSACGAHNHEHGHDAAQGHNHDGVSIPLSTITPRCELFADVEPLSVGNESHIVLHVSTLPDFRPLSIGKADVSLSVDGDIITEHADSLSEPGIFRLHLTPRKAGNGILTFIVTDQQQSDTLSAPVTIYSDRHEALHEADENMPHSSNAVSFTKEMSWKIPFSTAPVVMRPFGEVIHATARVSSSPADAISITARTAGTVTFASQLTQGTEVKAGTPLFTIDASALADNNLSVRIAEAKSAYEFAKSELDRNTELAKDRLVTASQLARAKADFDAARAAYNNLRSNFSAGRQNVTAPISGFLSALYVTNGQYVDAGQSLATVSRNDDLHITAEISQRHFSSLASISDVTFRTADGTTYSLADLNGSVVSYGRSVNPESSLIPITFRVNNSINLIPGAFIDIFIDTTPTDQAPTSLVVPTSAVMEEMGTYFVFVQLTPELFEKTPVTIGKSNGQFTVITSGLSQGMRVVDRGAVMVKLAQGSSKLDPHAGHVH